jgi:short subunit fatty acids transporter
MLAKFSAPSREWSVIAMLLLTYLLVERALLTGFLGSRISARNFSPLLLALLHGQAPSAYG